MLNKNNNCWVRLKPGMEKPPPSWKRTATRP